MGRRTENQSAIAREDWRWTSNDNGSWPVETMTAVGSAEAARRLGNVEGLLRSIYQLLQNLGSDGIHELIRFEARRVRKIERLRKGRIAAKRRRTIAARKASK